MTRIEAIILVQMLLIPTLPLIASELSELPELGPITPPTSEFWKKAETTLLLSQMRKDTPPPPLPPTARDPMLDNANFLPLCGNGRIDKKADYEAYYRTHPPLNLTTQEILPNLNDPTNSNSIHNVKILAEEECDDGNRLDLDGCSADCMHRDAWTSACEIAIDGLEGKNLSFEAIAYDQRNTTDMLVSLTDGIYSLSMRVGDTGMKLTLLASKTFPVTDIIQRNDNLNVLILYSAELQCFWELALKSISSPSPTWFLLSNLTDVLSPWNDRAYYDKNAEIGVPIVVHSNKKIMFLLSGARSIYDNICTSDIELTKCYFVTMAPNPKNPTKLSYLFMCDDGINMITVYMDYNGCQLIPMSNDKNQDQSLTLDVFDMAVRRTGLVDFVLYNMNVTTTPHVKFPTQFFFVRYYNPWGILLEMPMGSPRKFGTTTDPLPHFIGDPSLVRMVLNKQDLCDDQSCSLNTKLHYDIFEKNPAKNALAEYSWGDILQAHIWMEAKRQPPVQNLKAIKSDPERYSRLLEDFYAYFKSVTSRYAIHALLQHPTTGNLWALRRDRLVHISKTGAQVERPDGKCLPIGMALCPPCQYAPSGHACMPCSNADNLDNLHSLAWHAKCKSCPKTSRRLLAEEEGVKIHFSLTGNSSAIISFTDSLFKKMQGTRAEDATLKIPFFNVTITTKDPINDMRSLKEDLAALSNNNNVQVLTQPYEIVLIGGSSATPPTPPPPTPAPPAPSEDHTTLVIAIIVPLVVVIAIVVAVALSRHSQEHKAKSFKAVYNINGPHVALYQQAAYQSVPVFYLRQ